MTSQEMRSQLDGQLQEFQRQKAALVNRQRRKCEWATDLCDRADNSTEQFQNWAQYQFLEQRWQQCIHAKARIDEGLAGVCEICGRPINPERLEVMVEATGCVQCLQHKQRRLAGNIRRGREYPN